MKKYIFLALGAAVLSTGYSFAASSDMPFDPTLHQAQSCAEVESVIKSYLESHWNAGNFGPLRGGVIMNDMATKSAISNEGGMGGGGGADFSATNNQKPGVDEPEIIKNSGKAIYYIDAQKGVLRVLDPQTQKEVTTMKLPKDYWNAQLLINGSQLILVGSKSVPYNQQQADKMFVYNDQQVIVAVYSVETTTPKLVSAHTFDGYLQDSRVVNGELLLITTQGLNRGPVYRAVSDMVYNNTAASVSLKDFSIKSSDVMPKSSTLKQVTKTLKGGKQLTTTRSIMNSIDCTQFMYKKPDQQLQGRGYYGGESLTSMIRLPLVNSATTKPQIKTILTNNSQIHVSENSLYLTSPAYVPGPFVCPANARCLPWRGEGQSNTVIYGFDIKDLKYKYASVVNGTTWNQYSMDENSKGIFRIVTSVWLGGALSTNVYTIGSDGNILGKLENIAPEEQFHGVRFVGDYLYLVTYKQIDPLFAISVVDPTKPVVAGELKMPGYSTYLHPFGTLKNGVQYLIGLGYDTKVVENGGEQQLGVKLDLYKVDYNKKNNKGQVEVSQVWTKTYGEAGSQTEALYNPRMFVLNGNTSELILPIVTAQTKKMQSCNVRYDNGNEMKKECYPVEQPVTTFAGLKSWKVSEAGLTETMSVDYKDKITQPTYDGMSKPMPLDTVGGGQNTTVATFIDPRIFSSIMPRVGYNGDQLSFVSNQFAHFFTKANTAGTYIMFK